MAYIALIRSILEYGASVWDPHFQSDINKLERIQRQSARFIARDYKTRDPGCVTNMLKDLQTAISTKSPEEFKTCLLLQDCKWASAGHSSRRSSHTY